MGILFTAVSVKQYAELINSRNLPLSKFKHNFGLEFTEDKSFWYDRITNQEDLDNVVDYKFAIIIEFEADAQTINAIITNPQNGRLSERMIGYYNSINKPIIIQELKQNDINVLGIMDIYESDETADGISQLWQLFVDSPQSELWHLFTSSVHKIACLGGIPGSLEAAKSLVEDDRFLSS
jgi:hypothetical protein